MSVKKDAKAMNGIAGKYNGIGSAHVFGIQNGKERQFQLGGDAQQVAGLLLELLAQFSSRLPRKNRELFSRDFLTKYADAVLKMGEEEETDG